LAVEKTQVELAAELGVGQDTISRLEKRSDMLLSTLRHYVESMGGTLELVARFPNRPPVAIERLGTTDISRRRRHSSNVEIALPSSDSTGCYASTGRCIISDVDEIPLTMASQPSSDAKEVLGRDFLRSC
jgi:DNA-binding XRE family transcriptional regulator